MAERFSTPFVFALPVRNPPRVAFPLSITWPWAFTAEPHSPSAVWPSRTDGRANGDEQ
jgi:hypothetical protein